MLATLLAVTAWVVAVAPTDASAGLIMAVTMDSPPTTSDTDVFLLDPLAASGFLPVPAGVNTSDFETDASLTADAPAPSPTAKHPYRSKPQRPEATATRTGPAPPARAGTAESPPRGISAPPKSGFSGAFNFSGPAKSLRQPARGVCVGHAHGAMGAGLWRLEPLVGRRSGP